MTRRRHNTPNLWEKIEKIAQRVAQQVPQGGTELQYHAGMCAGLCRHSIPFACQVPVEVTLEKGDVVGERIPDLVVGVGPDRVVVELKAKVWFKPEHRAQLQGYLYSLKLNRGMLLGFNPLEMGAYNIEQVTPSSGLTRDYPDKRSPATEAQIETVKKGYWRRFSRRVGDDLPCIEDITKQQASRLIQHVQRSRDEALFSYMSGLSEFYGGVEPEPKPPRGVDVPDSPPAPQPRQEETVHHTPAPPVAHAPPMHMIRRQRHGGPETVPHTQRAEPPKSNTPPHPTPPQEEEPVHAPSPPRRVRKRQDLNITGEVYLWLVSEQVSRGARSLNALVRPWIEEDIGGSWDNSCRTSAPEKGEVAHRLTINSRDASFWGKLEDCTDLPRSADEKDFLRYLIHRRYEAAMACDRI